MRSRERWIWGRSEACWICRAVVCVWDVCWNKEESVVEGVAPRLQ